MGWTSKFFKRSDFRQELRHEHLYRVFRNVEPANVPNPWTRKLLQLADGRPATEIAETICGEPHVWGPLASELGVRSPLMRRSVMESLASMASLGLVRFEPAEADKKANPVQ